MTRGSERSGLAFAGLCALAAAFVAPVARLTTERGDPLFIAAAVTCSAGLAAAIVLAAQGRIGALARGADAPWFALLGAIGTMVPTLLFFVGTARTSSLDAVLCLQVEPAYSLLLAWLVLGHRLTARRVLAAVLLLAGIACAVSGESRADPLGIGLLLATPLAWQISHLIVLRRMGDASSRLLTGARYLWGGVWLSAAAAIYAFVTGARVLPERLADAQLPTLALQGMGLLCRHHAVVRGDRPPRSGPGDGNRGSFGPAARDGDQLRDRRRGAIGASALGDRVDRGRRLRLRPLATRGGGPRAHPGGDGAAGRPGGRRGRGGRRPASFSAE